MKRRLFYLFLMGFLGASSFFASKSFAEESNVNKAKDEIGDAKTDVKKDVRTAKRKVRKATGTDTVGKDIKDKANDVGDSISNGADKVKRKTESN